MADTVDVARDDLEEIRIAVVMNGGVSLAVWIGGVTNELNRLTQSPHRDPGGAYAALLQLLQSSARVDVISGTSAGGLNGGFLALAEVYAADLTGLGQLWRKQGAFDALLRDPFEKDPPSLMRGDEYFLRALREAFAAVFPADHERALKPAAEVPIDLTMTVSLMDGEPVRFVDDYGTQMLEIDHRGRLHFVRNARMAEEDDPFATPDVVERLALAARSTASFPGAFEPSYIPVGQALPRDRLHPDMKGVATFESSRFVMDGGVLMNQPIRPAIEAIFSQPATRQVRRILAYVNPDPRSADVELPVVDASVPPSLAQVMADSLIRLPGAQSVHAELEEILEHNRRVRDQRLSRIDLVGVLHKDLSLADKLFPTYRTIRTRRAVAHIADLVVSNMPRFVASPRTDGATVANWTREEVVAALGKTSFAYIPEELSIRQDGEVRTRRWGISPVERLASLAVDIFKRAMWVAPLADPALREGLRQFRGRLHDLRATVASFRRDDHFFWRAEAAAGLWPIPRRSKERPEELARWADDALQRWPTSRGTSDGGERDILLQGLEHVTVNIVELLVGARSSLRRAVELGRSSGIADLKEEAERLDALLMAVFGDEDELNAIDCLERLIRLEVCQMTLGGDPYHVEQEVELIQVSGNTETSFMRAPPAADKLAGVQLGHFGAFYKESWRVNDWIWGRLDGATRLCLAILSPQRLRQLGLEPEPALSRIREIAIDGARDDDRAALEGMFDEQACRDELSFLGDQQLPVPPSLPVCALAVARRIHLDILRSELHNLRVAVHSDIGRGARDRGKGADFAVAYDHKIKEAGAGGLHGHDVFALFAGAGIGSERIRAEVGTDQLADTVGTTAAVGVALAKSETSGLGAIRGIARTLRGITLALYAMVHAAVIGSSFAVFLLNLTLAVGGASLALALLVEDAPPLLGAVGATILLAAFGAAALLSRLRAYAAVLFAVAAALVAASLLLTGDLREVLDQLRSVAAIVLIVGLAALLGSLGVPRGRKRKEDLAQSRGPAS